MVGLPGEQFVRIEVTVTDKAVLSYVIIPKSDQDCHGANFRRDSNHRSLGILCMRNQQRVNRKSWTYVEVVLEGAERIFRSGNMLLCIIWFDEPIQSATGYQKM